MSGKKAEGSENQVLGLFPTALRLRPQNCRVRVLKEARAPTADPLDRGYVVPQASDATVARNARWGSRPMAEHRVMSEDLLA